MSLILEGCKGSIAEVPEPEARKLVQIGAWINVVGYVTSRNTAALKPSRRKDRPGSCVTSGSRSFTPTVQAIQAWSSEAGIVPDVYESAIIARRKALAAMAAARKASSR